MRRFSAVLVCLSLAGSAGASSLHRSGERDARWRSAHEIQHPSEQHREVNQLTMPVEGAVHFTDTFGAPRDGGRRHQGVDLFAARGTPVVAAASGIVSRVSNHRRAGNCIWLETADGTVYFYAHLDDFEARLETGRFVHAGDLLGYVGSTGNAAGSSPHLHFEVQRGGEAVNPYPLLVKAVSSHAESSELAASR